MNEWDHKFEGMRLIGGLVAECLRRVEAIIKPGITTKDIEYLVRGFQADHQLKNSQHGYRGFPGWCCTSVNEVICHGIPCHNAILEEGDIVKVDVTFNKAGWHGDACRTFYVGSEDCSGFDLKDHRAHQLMSVTHEAMMRGIAYALPGNRVSDISRAIETYVHSQGMSVVEEYTGHGIGRVMHQEPQVPHYFDPRVPDVVLEPGMTFTVEPMLTLGKKESFLFEDGWAVMSQDGSYSAQWEETIGVTDDQPEIFTK
jgi:methionyl aminopeptidase